MSTEGFENVTPVDFTKNREQIAKSKSPFGPILKGIVDTPSLAAPIEELNDEPAKEIYGFGLHIDIHGHGSAERTDVSNPKEPFLDM